MKTSAQKTLNLGTGLIRQGGFGVPEMLRPNTAPTIVKGRIIKRQMAAIAI